MTDKRVKWLTVHGLTSAHIVGAELGVELRAKGQNQALTVARCNRRPPVMVLAFSTLVLV